MFKKSWNTISNIGLQQNTGISVAKRIKLTNQLTTFALGLTFIYTFAFFLWRLNAAVKIELAAIVIYLLVLSFSYTKQHKLARFIFIIGLYIQMFALCLCFGEASQMHLLFIPAAAIPLILFDLKQVKIICLLVILGIATISMLYLINFSSDFFVALPAEFLAKMRVAVNITAILGEVAVICSFILNFEWSERKLDENNELLQQQLQAIFENSYDALFLVDWKKRKIIKANQRAVELFEMGSAEDFYDLYGFDLHKQMPSETEIKIMRDHLNTDKFYEGEALYKTRTGKEFWGSLAIKLVVIGNEKYQSVRVTDITVEKKAMAHVATSLHEKEILLSEIHHRVKNNMAVISGLLGLQSSYVEDERSRSLFEESRNRIHSMALIHDKLYQHETFAQIDFDAYCKDLVGFIKSSYNNTTASISYSISCTDVFIDIKNAIPCGLILNELISNAHKHAFNGRSEGEIKIVCTKMGEKFTMMVSDNGIGYDAENILGQPVSLGLTLITALVAQVSGTIKAVNKNGTTYYISFEE